MKKRIISLLLSLIMLLSLTPITYAADINDNAGWEGLGGGSGAGTFRDDQSGYRVYMANRRGEIVSTVVDIVFTDPIQLVGSDKRSGAYFLSTKFEPAGFVKNAGDTKLAYNGSDLGSFKGRPYVILGVDKFENSDVSINTLPYPLRYKKVPGMKNSVYIQQGSLFRDWFMQGEGEIRPTVNYVPSYPTGSNTNSNKNNNAGSSEDQKTNTLNDACNRVMRYVDNRMDYYRSMGVPEIALLSIVKREAKGTIEGALFEMDPSIRPAARDAMTSTLTDYTNYLDKTLNYDANEYNAWVSAGKPIPWTSNQYKNKKNASVQNNLLSIAYADTSGNPANPDKGQVYKLINYIYGDNYLFSVSGNDNNGNPIVVKENEVPTDTLVANDLMIVVEPVFWFLPAQVGKNGAGEKCAVNACGFWFYGTPTNYAQFIKAGGYNDGDSEAKNWYGRVINKVAAHAFMLARDEEIIGKYTIKAPTTSSENYIGKNTLSRSDMGYAMHIYFGKTGASSTHTWDNVNYPDPSGFKEHPAPDPKLDPPTKDQVQQLQDHLHYRVVKVYDKEVINPNGSKSVVHISTHIREETLPIIEIQDELEAGKYKVVNWKYSDEYFGCTEGANGVGTAWTDQPIASITGSLIVEQGTSPVTVNIQDPSDPEKERTLYVELRKERDSTTTWDEPNHPEGDPAPAPEPPKSDDPNNPYTVQIVKTYRIKKLDGSYQYVGTYLRERNPGLIQVDDEPDYRLKEWFISKDTIPSVTTKNWEQITSQAAKTGESGTSEKKVDVLSPNKAIYSPHCVNVV